jgi:hypothetical protein
MEKKMIKKSAGIIIFLIFINTVKIYGNLQIISVNKINTSEISSNITASNNKIYYLSDSSLYAYDIGSNSEEKIYNFSSTTITTSYFDKDNNEIKTEAKGLIYGEINGIKSLAYDPKKNEFFLNTKFNILEKHKFENSASLYSVNLESKKFDQIIKPRQKEFNYLDKKSQIKSKIGFEWDVMRVRGCFDDEIVYLEVKSTTFENRLVLYNKQTSTTTLVDTDIDGPVSIQNNGKEIAYTKQESGKVGFRLFVWSSNTGKTTEYENISTLAMCWSPDDDKMICTNRYSLYSVDFADDKKIELEGNEKLNGLLISDIIWPLKNTIYILNGVKGEMYEVKLEEK